MITVTASEFQQHFGRYQDEALTQPVAITRNGRERLGWGVFSILGLSALHKIASMPLRRMTLSSTRAAPVGRFAPRSSWET